MADATFDADFQHPFIRREWQWRKEGTQGWYPITEVAQFDGRISGQAGNQLVIAEPITDADFGHVRCAAITPSGLARYTDIAAIGASLSVSVSPTAIVISGSIPTAYVHDFTDDLSLPGITHTRGSVASVIDYRDNIATVSGDDPAFSTARHDGTVFTDTVQADGLQVLEGRTELIVATEDLLLWTRSGEVDPTLRSETLHGRPTFRVGLSGGFAASSSINTGINSTDTGLDVVITLYAKRDPAVSGGADFNLGLHSGSGWNSWDQARVEVDGPGSVDTSNLPLFSMRDLSKDMWTKVSVHFPAADMSATGRFYLYPGYSYVTYDRSVIVSSPSVQVGDCVLPPVLTPDVVQVTRQAPVVTGTSLADISGGGVMQIVAQPEVSSTGTITDKPIITFGDMTDGLAVKLNGGDITATIYEAGTPLSLTASATFERLDYLDIRVRFNDTETELWVNGTSVMGAGVSGTIANMGSYTLGAGVCNIRAIAFSVDSTSIDMPTFVKVAVEPVLLRDVGVATHWQGHTDPTTTEPFQSGSHYYRIFWSMIEGTEGVYDWSAVDSVMATLRSQGRACLFTGPMLHDNVNREYSPIWIRDDDDYKRGVFSINWDYQYFWDKHADLITEWGRKWNGHPDVAAIDIRSVGCWGEWHLLGESQYMPTQQQMYDIIDMYRTAFPDTPLVMPVLHPDNDRTPLWYAADNGIAWRGDSWWYNNGPSEQHRSVYDAAIADARLTDNWQLSPVLFESYNQTMADWISNQGTIWQTIGDELEMYHGSSVHHVNNPMDPAYFDGYYHGYLRAGYRVAIRHHAITGTTLNLAVLNHGTAPAYRDWRVFYKLDSGADVETTASIKGLLPGVLETLSINLTGYTGDERVEVGLKLAGDANGIVTQFANASTNGLFLIKQSAPVSEFMHEFSTGIGVFEHYRDSVATVTHPDYSVDKLANDEPGIINGAGLQVESESTNVITHSEDFTQGWVNTGPPWTSTTVTAPDGTATAFAMRYRHVGTDRMYHNVLSAGALNDPVAISMFIQGLGLPKTSLRVAGYEDGYAVGDAFIEADTAPLTWTRGQPGQTPALFTQTNPFVIGASLEAGLDTHDTSTDANTTPSTFNLWGVQQEVGRELATSYIPTNGSAVTRAPVHVKLPLAAIPMANITGDCSGQLTYIDRIESGSADTYYIDLTDGTTTNRIRIYRPSGGDSIALNIGAATATVASAPRTAGTEHTIKFKVDTGADRLVIWYDGTPTEVSGVVAPAGAITQVAICDDYDPANDAVEDTTVKKVRLLDYAEDDSVIDGWT